jgi:hypothetical protein
MTDTDSNFKIREHHSAIGFTKRIKAALGETGTGLRYVAPVKAPFSWPNSSAEISDGASAAQFTLTKARSDRWDVPFSHPDRMPDESKVRILRPCQRAQPSLSLSPLRPPRD